MCLHVKGEREEVQSSSVLGKTLPWGERERVAVGERESQLGRETETEPDIVCVC